jgi:hypothetical protein
MLPIDDLAADVLILGAGGADMLAALQVTTANPRARIVIAVKASSANRVARAWLKAATTIPRLVVLQRARIRQCCS